MLLVVLISVISIIMVVRVLFMLLNAVVRDSSSHFLRNVGSRTYFCFCSNGGSSYSHGATNNGGVQTSFLSALEMLLVLLNSVVIIIMLMQIIIVHMIVTVVCVPVRNVASSTQFCNFHRYGRVDFNNAGYAYGGVRPSFLLTR